MADQEKITRKQFAANLKREEPRFANVPDDKLVDTVLARYPKFREQIMDVATLPPGEVRRPATGVRGAENTAATAAYAFTDWLRKNFDVAGGTVGALAGGTTGLAGGPVAPVTSPIGALLGAVLGGGAGRAMTQLSDFARGKPKASAGEAMEDISLGGIEQGIQELGGMGIAKIGKMIAPVSRGTRLAYGVRAGELGPQIDALIPDFDKTLARSGIKEVKNIGDFDKVVHNTSRDLETEFGLALQPINGQSILPMSVASEVMNEITPNMAKTPEGRQAMNFIRRQALQYQRQTWTIRELNAERQTVTARLQSWHAAEASGQAASEKVQSRIAADTATERALKDLIYDAADRSGSKPPGYFASLKRKQSALTDLIDSIGAAKKNLTKSSYEAKGAPLSEKLHLRTYFHPKGLPGGVAGLNLRSSDPLAAGNKAIREGFPTSARAGVRTARTVAGKALSKEGVNALPIRALFADWSNPVPESQEGVQP